MDTTNGLSQPMRLQTSGIDRTHIKPKRENADTQAERLLADAEETERWLATPRADESV